jgi:hypothetical protein
MWDLAIVNERQSKSLEMLIASQCIHKIDKRFTGTTTGYLSANKAPMDAEADDSIV